MMREVIVPVVYGLILFFAGMKLMENALHKLAGPLLIQGLNRATSSPWKGMLFSTVITALLQSSTAVTVLSMGLVNAGLLSFGQTLGIILGSNIGTCLTTELISLQIGRFAWPLLAVCLALWAFTVLLYEFGRPSHRPGRSPLLAWQYGSLAGAGFALVLGGIRTMQLTAPYLERTGVFSAFLEQAAHSPWWGFAAGACLTALIHSSAAVIGMAISMAGAGILPVEIGVTIVIGANVGTCVTALMASVGGTRAAAFVAWSHIALNAGGALLFMPLAGLLQAVSAWLSADPGAQIAHAQTLFNIACSLLALPLCYLPVWRKVDRNLHTA
ncbi:Na/Pi symporter [Paenibacillus sp. JX-17]|uniref:Na/Pi symporter n=1 Tax=Paenibacillus lacisoli TaxID=3064525 RepID=A0ABT9CCS0_9BACL|nr:Na/Pi symporter [Paenibacillus sp. JX-17]MDO7905471.1 Na/Pi symporter [Paenibacillus sp. JX-17]